MSDRELATLGVLNLRIADLQNAYAERYPQLVEINRLMREVGMLEFGEIAPSDVLSSRDDLLEALKVAYDVMATGDNCGAEQLEYVEAVLANATLS